MALSCIGMAGFLAAAADKFNWLIFVLCCLTTIFLQVLSNLANDYGDSVNGADHAGRKGPSRAVQSGVITRNQMKNAVIIAATLCLVTGITLLLVSFGPNWSSIWFFLCLGLLSIVAAITYTMGRKPYGYAGFGDLSVLVFFGVVGVMGSLYLFTQEIDWTTALPALSCGFFSIAVLNINNIRDIESDLAAGKYSIPVRIGKRNAARYQWFLLMGGNLAAIAYCILNFRSPYQFLFLIAVPLFLKIGIAVGRKKSEELDPFLKQMALTTLVFVVLFGVGSLISY